MTPDIVMSMPSGASVRLHRDGSLTITAALGVMYRTTPAAKQSAYAAKRRAWTETRYWKLKEDDVPKEEKIQGTTE